jgi:hypothetical protein
MLFARVPHGCGLLNQSLSLWRPRARRALSTLRPPWVALRARNPHLRALLIFEGLNVGCMIASPGRKKEENKRFCCRCQAVQQRFFRFAKELDQILSVERSYHFSSTCMGTYWSR